MALTDEQIERYSRHIILKEVGAKGQKKLLNAKVLIIGAGGLGAPAAMYLGAAGVGTIGIVDADEVDLSNLQRQIIHGTADIGKAKVKSAKETINAMNPDVTVKTYRQFVTSENIMDLIADYDFIIDGTDNFPAKFLINDACVMAKKPFSHAGIIRFKGQLMTYVPGEGPRYSCCEMRVMQCMPYFFCTSLQFCTPFRSAQKLYQHPIDIHFFIRFSLTVAKIIILCFYLFPRNCFMFFFHIRNDICDSLSIKRTCHKYLLTTGES